jgi:hypothetical protein
VTGILRRASIINGRGVFPLTRKLRSARLPTSPRKRGEVNWTRSACFYRTRRDPSAICADFRREVLASCGVTAVRESCVIRSRATPEEPFGDRCTICHIDDPASDGISFRPLAFYLAVEKHRVSGEYRLHKNLNQRRTSLRSAGRATLSDLEFQRELSPEQMREALSLLDSTAGTQNQTVQIEDLRPAEEFNPEPDQSSTTMPTQDRPPAAEDPQQSKKHLKVAVGFFSIGIAAVGALALLSWWESVPPPPMLEIADEQPPKQPPAPAAKGDSPALLVANPPPDQSPGGSERQPTTPEQAGVSGAVTDMANSDSAIPLVARSATNQAPGTSQARWNERVSRRSEHTRGHARAVRVAAAQKRFWRLHWQARANDEWCIVACRRADGEWCFFACRTWRAQPVFYEPPRSVIQSRGPRSGKTPTAVRVSL